MAELKRQSDLFRDKMQAEGCSQLVIDTFLRYYSQMTSGNTGFIYETDLMPVKKGSLPEYNDLSSYSSDGENALKHAVIIKLNGGLGTSMGLDGPKCMLPAKESLSFFDIAANQIRELNKNSGIQIPFILMNSFRTDEETQKLIKQYPDLLTDIPNTFIQNKYPKILQDSLRPATWQDDPVHEWNPSGHGDIYTSLVSSGILQELLNSGIRYAFISNIDNLGATLDTCLLGYFASNTLPFMMEAVPRTEIDKKGGHIARLVNKNQLILRELAQTTENEVPSFQDVEKYCYFNSNNLWINLEHLHDVMHQTGTRFNLPFIINKKHLIPKNKNTPAVFQLETAMGSAISLFPGSQAVAIPDNRFIPVKKCDDLLVLWSDYYLLNRDYSLIRDSQRVLPPIKITLDKNYYGTYDKMKERFPSDIPSLLHCKSLCIEGDVCFGAHSTINGEVTISNKSEKQVCIPDGSIIDSNVTY